MTEEYPRYLYTREIHEKIKECKRLSLEKFIEENRNKEITTSSLVCCINDDFNRKISVENGNIMDVPEAKKIRIYNWGSYPYRGHFKINQFVYVEVWAKDAPNLELVSSMEMRGRIDGNFSKWTRDPKSASQ